MYRLVDNQRTEPRAGQARMNLTALLQLRARRGPGLPNLCRLLADRNAPPENPLHLTLGGDASTSETPKARCNLFMDLLSRSRGDRRRNVGLQDPNLFF